MTNDNQGRDSARGLGVPRFAPGMTCVVIDHPLWKNPVKRLILGCHVVLLSRVYSPSKYIVRQSDYGWYVSGMPPAFLAARRRQIPDYGGWSVRGYPRASAANWFDQERARRALGHFSNRGDHRCLTQTNNPSPCRREVGSAVWHTGAGNSRITRTKNGITFVRVQLLPALPQRFEWVAERNLKGG